MWRLRYMGRCRTSVENKNQIKLDRAAYVQAKWRHKVFILSQVRKRKLSREQEMFIFPLNLLQTLIAKALCPVAKLFSREIRTKYICFQSLWESYQAVSCASDKLGFHQIGRRVCSLCLAFSLLWLQFLKGSFLNSSINCQPSSSYFVGTSKC